jgi:A/G-specific adenine glycosylase
MVDFHRLITEWYRLNKRELPWRNTTDPYFIWLSEIILQQTRVAQGLEYYLKFTRNYPTIFELATASEQTILKDWQGLGYYSRARNLHATAKVIAFEKGGVFPATFQEIRALKGVGDYTAAAISSFAFDLPFSVVDGNVYRLLSRVYDVDFPIDSTVGRKYFAALAQELLDVRRPAVHNQAIMELGALQCLPANPICDSCPLESLCLAKSRGLITIRPVKAKKTVVKDRFFHFMIFSEGDKLVLEKRKGKGIWQHLFQFPLIETETYVSPDEMKDVFAENVKLEYLSYSAVIIHVLSHQKINARFYWFDQFPQKEIVGGIFIEKENIQDFPMPRLIDRFLETNIL